MFFKKNFVSEGEWFYISVKLARNELEDLYEAKTASWQIPGVSWLPIIYQNTTALVRDWDYLSGSNLIKDLKQFAQNIIKNKLELTPFGFGEKKEFNLYVDLGLMERKTKPKVLPEENDSSERSPKPQSQPQKELENIQTFK